jgi:hypothetical protein
LLRHGVRRAIRIENHRIEKQLSGYYCRRGKVMTNDQRRDKESSAQGHRKKSAEDDHSS